ncbi:MAG: hypothetical protein ACI9XC_000721 [Gammaproteobacteria bacterium]|jgi:hypothetical protein
MSNDQVLSEAMEVFNQSVQTGNMPGGSSSTQGQQGQSGPLDRTASATGTQGEQNAASNSQNGGLNPQSGSGAMPGMEGTGVNGTGSDPYSQTGAGSSANPGSETMGSIGSEDSGFGGAPVFGASSSGNESGAGNNDSNTQGQGGGVGNDPAMQGSGNVGLSGRRVIVIGNGQGVLTEDERVGNYDKDLEEQMRVFDGIILGRRQETIAQSNEDGAGDINTGSSGGFGSNSGFDSAPSLVTASVDPNNNTTTGQIPDAPSDNRQGDFKNQSNQNSNIPSDISDGSDDDIVARQLREAAIAEQDPGLQEKLWDEYRKYKEGVQVRR